MVTIGVALSHQSLRTSGRGVCSEVIYEGTVQHTCTPANGQSDCSGVCQQDGRHSLSSPDASSLQIVAVVPPQRDNTFSRVPPWQPEQGGRRRVLSGLDLSRMEAQSRCVSNDSEVPGHLCSESVCHVPQPPVTQV